MPPALRHVVEADMDYMISADYDVWKMPDFGEPDPVGAGVKWR